MKRMIALILVGVLLSTCAFAVGQPSFRFSLAVDGQTQLQAAPGDVITVTLTLDRTDSKDGFTMYAMQDEICYDKTFFRLVENSDRTGDGIRTNDLALRDHRRAHYLSYVSLLGGKSWKAQTVIGSFQLEVIGTSGVSKITSSNFQVSLPDGSGSYPVTANELTVTISDRCPVRFETGEGSAVPPQTVAMGQSVTKPADPTRFGYTFGGWFRDVDHTIPWDFAVDRVSENLHLYAKWDKSEFNPSFTDVNPGDWFYEDVEYVKATGLMDGTGGGRFAPQASTNRAMIVTILWRMEGKPMVASANSFRDVANGMWYSDAIRWAAANQIVTGYSALQFGPMDNVTREQMATILYRYANYKGYALSARADLQRYTDYKKISSWAGEGLAWANANGLINGLPGDLLAPQNHAVRCQTAAILHRFMMNIS